MNHPELLSTYDQLQEQAITISYALTSAGKSYSAMTFLVMETIVDQINRQQRKPLIPITPSSEQYSVYELELMCGINVILVVNKHNGGSN